MIIRANQLQTFRESGLRQFEEQMVAHVREFAPQLCKAAGDAGTRQSVRLGVERAERRGFTNRGPVRLYIELMVALGCDFDSDPQYPWIPEILSDPASEDQMRRADRLYKAFRKYSDQVGAPRSQQAIQRLRDIVNTGPRQFESLQGSFVERAIAALKRVYPQKGEYLGDSSLSTVANLGLAMAASFSVSTDLGKGLFVGLIFGFGHGVATDPLYPWIANTMNNPLVANPDDRAQRLFEKTMIYVDRVLLHLAEN